MTSGIVWRLGDNVKLGRARQSLRNCFRAEEHRLRNFVFSLMNDISAPQDLLIRFSEQVPRVVPSFFPDNDFFTFWMHRGRMTEIRSER